MMESSIFNVLEIFCPSVRNKWISVTVTCRTRPECLRCLGELSFRYIGCQPAASARIYSPQPMCVGIVLQKPVLGNCYRLRVSLRASQVPRTHVICHKSSRQMTDKWLVICHKSCELWRVICLSFQRNNVTNWLVTNWLVTNDLSQDNWQVICHKSICQVICHVICHMTCPPSCLCVINIRSQVQSHIPTVDTSLRWRCGIFRMNADSQGRFLSFFFLIPA